MIVTLAIALLVQAIPVATVRTTERTGSIEIPDDIAPAVIPYFLCLNDRSNAATQQIMARDKVSGLDGPQLREANTMALTDCKATRATSAANASKALDTREISDAGARTKMIEDTLTGFEASMTASADKLDEFNRTHAASGNKNHAPNQ